MITDQQFIQAAALIGCRVEAIRAVYDVEAAGKGFLADGRVKILFEGHRFWRQLTKAGFDTAQISKDNIGSGNILYKDWTKKHYIGGAGEWDRMSEAIALCKQIGADAELALKSASYGSFQIMGENCRECGYATAHEMGFDFSKGEAEQLKAFVRFVKSKGLDDELRNLNWAKFAEGYNGTAYRENKYDKKLASRYLYYTQ